MLKLPRLPAPISDGSVYSLIVSFSLLTFTLFLSPDVDVPSPDEKSVITYVSSIYDAFPKIPEGGEGIAANVGHTAL